MDHPGPKARGLQSKHGMFHSALPGTSSPLQSRHPGARRRGHYIRYMRGSRGGSGTVVVFLTPHRPQTLRPSENELFTSRSQPSPVPPPLCWGPVYAGMGRPVEGDELVAVIAPPLLHHRCCCCSLINRYVRVGSPRWGVDLGSQLEPVERTP